MAAVEDTLWLCNTEGSYCRARSWQKPIAAYKLGRMRAFAQLLLLILFIGGMPCHADGARHWLVAIDPGHTPQDSGALSCRGTKEVIYNDGLAELVVEQLTQKKFSTFLTRKPTEEIALGARAAKANDANADLFISIHHDSANPVYLEPFDFDGQPAIKALKALRNKFDVGYSIFVSKENPHYEDSLRLAKLIAANLSALGRPVSTHHEEAIPGEDHEFLDRKLGIYRYDGLAVLRRTKMPAVLIETGVLIDPVDEAAISDPKQKALVAKAIADAVARYADTKQ